MSAVITVYGHRGCSAHAPENTIASFGMLAELAQRVTAGSRVIIGVELDVQLSADGELVVFHDWDLQRIAGLPTRITAAAYRELARIDVGSWFDARFAAERIPRLHEVFELLGERVVYDIELKHREHGETALEAAVARAIRHGGLQRRCLVSSFNPYALRGFRRHAPSIPLGLIYADDPDVPWILRRGAGRFLVSVDVLKPRRQQARTALRRLRIGRRLPVVPWTVNDPATARELLELGCSGIISDDPQAISAVVR